MLGSDLEFLRIRWVSADNIAQKNVRLLYWLWPEWKAHCVHITFITWRFWRLSCKVCYLL